MQLKRFNLLLLLLTSFCVGDENILSNNQKEIFDLKFEQAKENSSKLKKDWINSVNYKYTTSNSRFDNSDYTSSSVVVDQPIFKSGGIYEAIKYANATYKYDNIDIQTQKKTMIKDALTLLFNIDILKLQIAQQKLLLENLRIDVERKKEQVINGFLNTSDLDNAILDKNQAANNILDMEYNLDELINNFSNYSDEDYNYLPRPTFTLVDEKDYIKNNLNITKADYLSEVNDHYSGMILSKYLPSLNATYNYTYYHEIPYNAQAQENYSYGMYINIPFNLNMLNEYQSAKIDYLIAKKDLINKNIQETNYYKNALKQIDTYDKKIKLANEDEELYNSLVKDISSLFDAGLKTSADVETMKNSKNIKELDKKILNLQKQLIMLDIYSRVNI